jgi:hypothetical protein
MQKVAQHAARHPRQLPALEDKRDHKADVIAKQSAAGDVAGVWFTGSLEAAQQNTLSAALRERTHRHW